MTAAAARHRVLIVGVGSIGERHLRCFHGTGRADVSFVEINASLRSTIAERYPHARSFDDLSAALAAGADAAVIATPAPSHLPLATQLARAGLHVLIEKPLAVSPDGLVELRRALEQQKTLTAVAYVYRAHPALADMRRAILSNEFGKPLQIVAVSGQHFATYRPAYHQTYYASHETGGGAVQDALTHVINGGEWLIGRIDRLVADAAHQALPGVDVEDTVHVIARHGNVMASYSLNQHQAPNELTITVICERGTVRFENHHCHWRVMTTPAGQWIDHDHGPLERDALFVRQANAFLDAVEGKSPPLCSLDEGAATLRVNRAILASARARAWQEVTA